ncbi:MAG: hypothetical protein ACI9JN_001679 [Bacteroidia bacterium]|jgi:hypothetical protein
MVLRIRLCSINTLVRPIHPISFPSFWTRRQTMQLGTSHQSCRWHIKPETVHGSSSFSLESFLSLRLLHRKTVLSLHGFLTFFLSVHHRASSSVITSSKVIENKCLKYYLSQPFLVLEFESQMEKNARIITNPVMTITAGVSIISDSVAKPCPN